MPRWLVLLLFAAPALLRAQASEQKPLAFEVASISLNTSGEFRPVIQLSQSGRFTAINVPTRSLIRYAYSLQDFEIGELPNWTTDERYDVVATSAGEPPIDQVREMVRTLLTERFKLKAHAQKQEQQLYALMLSSRDGSVGPRMRRSEADCAIIGAPQTPPADPLAPRPCGFMGPAPGGAATGDRSLMAFRGLTMPGLARMLVAPLRHGVLDRTGLGGYFDGEFEFSAEFGPPPPPPGVADPLDRPSLPSIFTTFRENLGLKLESVRGPVNVLVIDHVERPTPD